MSILLTGSDTNKIENDMAFKPKTRNTQFNFRFSTIQLKMGKKILLVQSHKYSKCQKYKENKKIEYSRQMQFNSNDKKSKRISSQSQWKSFANCDS